MVLVIIILGAYRCGSTSLLRWLQCYTDEKVTKDISFYRHTTTLVQDPKDTYWVILRKDINKFYDSMHRKFHPEVSFQEFFEGSFKDIADYPVKEMGNWDFHLNILRNRVGHLNVVYLEDMMKLSDFPHVNKNLA